MPESLSIASPSAVAVPLLISRNTARVAISILLTLLDSWAAVAFGGTLYRVSAHHPIWFRRRKEITFTTCVECLDELCSSIRHGIYRASD